jgi:hypothetical protein
MKKQPKKYTITKQRLEEILDNWDSNSKRLTDFFEAHGVDPSALMATFELESDKKIQRSTKDVLTNMNYLMNLRRQGGGPLGSPSPFSKS